MNDIYEWANRWAIPGEALNELVAMSVPVSDKFEGTEAANQQNIRLTASRIGANLWRNNVGAALDKTGRPVRYGLGNDSKSINSEFKSPDLVGLTPIMVTPNHVGHVLGVFTGVEVKHGKWSYNGTVEEQAQLKFLQLIKAKGGFATFARSTQDYMTCINVHV